MSNDATKEGRRSEPSLDSNCRFKIYIYMSIGELSQGSCKKETFLEDLFLRPRDT